MHVSSSVRLHGGVIRSLRESKGLTQLYVAEVVGVTVDTVSRWENNRTSTVKRDNALALARALEVGLEEILRDEPAAPPTPEPTAPDPTATEGSPSSPTPTRQPRRSLLLLLATIALSMVLGAGLWTLWPGAAPRAVATRRLPAYVAPGAVVPVIVRLRSDDSETRRVVLREHLPAGWTFVASTTPPDSGPTPEGLVRWILPAGPAVTQLAYLVRSPVDQRTSSRFTFRGEIVTPGRRGRQMPTQGDDRVDLEWIHWADDNGDFQVSDAELLDALDRVEAARALGMDGAEIRALWAAGAYHWDETESRFATDPIPAPVEPPSAPAL